MRIPRTRLVSQVLGLTTILTVANLATCVQPGFSRSIEVRPTAGKTGFWCSTTKGDPITMYQNSTGKAEAWIRWKSKTFMIAGHDPLTRCMQVSDRLETYRLKRRLNYITVGIINGEQVICTANQGNGRCQSLILTLKPGQNPIKTLYALLAWRDGLFSESQSRSERRGELLSAAESLDASIDSTSVLRAAIQRFSQQVSQISLPTVISAISSPEYL